MITSNQIIKYLLTSYISGCFKLDDPQYLRILHTILSMIKEKPSIIEKIDFVYSLLGPYNTVTNYIYNDIISILKEKKSFKSQDLNRLPEALKNHLIPLYQI